jgi:hypothetical protein
MGTGTRVYHCGWTGRLAGLGLLTLVWLCGPGVNAARPQGYKTYVSQKYGFSCQYPAAYKLQSSSANYLDFNQDGKNVISLWVDDRFIELLYQMLHPGLVVYRAGQNPYKKLAEETRTNPELFRGYARRQAKNWCAADGPDSSIYCRDFKSERAFISRGGFKCLEFYPVMIREDFAEHTEARQVAGPLFAVEMPTPHLPVVLMISPPLGRKASPGAIRDMRELVDSLRVER